MVISNQGKTKNLFLSINSVILTHDMNCIKARVNLIKLNFSLFFLTPTSA